MDETPQKKKIIGRPFQKGNKLAAGERKSYTIRAREYAEARGWDKLEKWADSRNWKASIAALTTILAYAYGKPRESVKFEGSVPLSIHQWFLSIRNGSLTPGGIPPVGTEQPRMVLPGSVGDNGVGKTNGHSQKHSGQA